MFQLFDPKGLNLEPNSMTMIDIIESFIEDFDKSDQRVEMMLGDKYYRNENDINDRQIFRFDETGAKVIDELKPNNRLSHAFMKLLVDGKIGYFLGKSPNITAENKTMQERIIEILDEEFDDILNDIGTEASNKGIAWLHPYINESEDIGELQFTIIPSEQCVPIWADNDHKILEGMIRYYFVEAYEGKLKTQIKKVEYWTADDVMYYTEFNGDLIPDIDANPTGEPIGHYTLNNEQRGWGRVPFIPFKNNSRELNDLHFVKSIADEYDKTTSDTANTLEEIQQLIYVLRNYGGTSLAEFVRDMKYYKAIKIDDDGGVDTLKGDVNIEATDRHLDRLKEDFYQFGQGVDMDTDKFGNSPSGVALEFLYSGMKLKVDNMERKFKKAFKILFWFICEYLKLTNKGMFDPKEAKVTFNRSIITNATEMIDSVSTSVGVISKKTAIAHHPWVEDVDLEMEQLEEEEEKIDFNTLDIVPPRQNNLEGNKEGDE